MIASQFVKTIILVKQYHSDIQFISAMSTIKKKIQWFGIGAKGKICIAFTFD